MKTQILLALLLATTFVLGVGLEGDYIVVVDEDAPTSDVVTAANFAASVSEYATFSGVEMADAQSLSEDDLEGKYVILLSGDSVTLLGSDENDAVFEQYFEDAGFEVETIAAPDKDDLVLPEPEELPEEPTPTLYVPEVDDEVIVEYEPVGTEDPVKEELVAQAKTPRPEPEAYVCDGCVYEDECVAIGETVDVDGLAHICGEEGLAPQAEEPGFFARLWTWLKNLF